ncbi:MAG: SDR family NAD(P)-dependent oxidoreductase [Dermatophilaceae bacterium]
MSERVIVVVGAGPGVGASVARRFGQEGYSVVLLSRDAVGLGQLSAALQADGIDAAWTDVDVTDDVALHRAVNEAGERFGRIDVLHFNPSAFRQKDPLALTPDELLEDLRLGVGALLVAVQAARPFMPVGGRVTATGSMAADRPWNEAASLGVQKAGLRNLVRSIDATLEQHGIRAVSVTVNGTLAPGTPFAPEHVADALFAAACQDISAWRAEVSFDGG